MTVSGPIGLTPQFSTVLQQETCRAIATYLNEAIALHPPLTVTGQPPCLQIYLPSQHVCSIASVLFQVENNLKALQGTKYWDIYIYVVTGNADGSPPRLAHHALLERSQSTFQGADSVPFQPLQPHSLLDPRLYSSSHRVSKGAAHTVRYPYITKRRIVKSHLRRQWLFLGAIALSVASFALGSWIASSGLRSFRIALISNTLSSRWVDSSTSLVEPMPSSSAETTQPSSIEIAQPPLQPITENTGLGAAANVLAVPPPAPAAVKLKAVGDIIPGTNYPDYRIPNDPNALFSSVQMFLGEVDLLFGNFESTLTNHPYSAKDISRGMTFAFRTPPEFASVHRAVSRQAYCLLLRELFGLPYPIDRRSPRAVSDFTR
ncbi:CapA family protein [Oscillatoria sp. CS-180]|uniref:CapA family protein n=1 Tax=Oscillatoria sp. CS-180 TaxID=3021720 RepID=UPI00232DA81A|nr:CapA family protein [Oscillatoria sp. CS-180]MDB9524623.1 CapA family protein [Oscillatoria sp. CS-180]